MKLVNSPHCGQREDINLRCVPLLFFPSCFSGGIRFGATWGIALSILRFLNPFVSVQDLRRTGTMYSVASSTLRIVTTRNTSARLAINIPRSFLPAKVYAFVARLTISNRQGLSAPKVSATFLRELQCLLHRLFRSSTESSANTVFLVMPLARRAYYWWNRISSTFRPPFCFAALTTSVSRHTVHNPCKTHDHIYSRGIHYYIGYNSIQPCVPANVLLFGVYAIMPLLMSPTVGSQCPPRADGPFLPPAVTPIPPLGAAGGNGGTSAYRRTCFCQGAHDGFRGCFGCPATGCMLTTP